MNRHLDLKNVSPGDYLGLCLIIPKAVLQLDDTNQPCIPPVLFCVVFKSDLCCIYYIHHSFSFCLVHFTISLFLYWYF